jgi:exonuclease SbcC
MHISRIELEDIKSHTHATFEFTRGTTAITGENGAGKTTIIEAIAWVLFDLLDYKKEDFVRRGAKKGIVRVWFESGLDERVYIVYRDSGAGYNVTDPRLNTRIADKKDEVVRFLWQHLGLEPGTDLRSLFRQAIGVPQGTFTAIFLEGATERKVAFDRLLKVEEYRQAADKLRETVRYVEMATAGVRENIARAEGELSRSDLLEQELAGFAGQSADLERDLATLDKEVAEKRELLEKLERAESIQLAIDKLRSDQRYALEKLEGVEKAKAEILTLQTSEPQQIKLEQDVAELRDKLAAARAMRSQIGALDERITRLRAAYRTHLDRLREAETRGVEAAALTDLETQSGVILREIAEARAHLERDERFQSEIRGGFCPVLSEKCLNIKPGQTLEGFLTTQFGEMRSHIAELETRRTELDAKLVASRNAARFAAALDDLRTREAELKAEGQQLAAEKKELEARASATDELERSLADAEQQLAKLNDPRGRIKLLSQETSRENELRSSLASAETELKKLGSDLRLAVAALPESASGLAVSTERANLHDTEKRRVAVRTTLTNLRDRERALRSEVEKLVELRMSLTAEFREKERLETVGETVAFIRDTLKEAAPRVARNYVYHVSLEANQMFREIMGDATRSLKWAEDYSIVLEEDGYERPFASLSGGEQMAAALAVRLGLLKQLSDIRVAFFDEPTTNMDLERRDNLAQQISRITNFDQLFVISHDETFDNFVDNVIEVRRGEAAVS